MSNSGGAQHNCTLEKVWGGAERLYLLLSKRGGGLGPCGLWKQLNIVSFLLIILTIKTKQKSLTYKRIC